MPEKAALVGVWRPTAATSRALAKGAYRRLKPRIEIRDDGSIAMRETPDTWQTIGPKDPGRAAGFTGTWTLERQQNAWWGIVLKDENSVCDGCLGILNQDPPYLLVLRYGDPDSGDGYEFE